jgi:hypothetical protein
MSNEVDAKFTRFKEFVRSAAPDSTLLSLFLAMPLGAFLETVKARAAEDMSVSEITNRVLSFASLQREQFTAEQLERFGLYIDYFIWASRNLA